MLRGLRATIVAIVILAVVFLVATQILLPPFFTARLEETLRARFPEARSLEVQVGGFPAYRLLLGVIGGIRVDGQELIFEGVPVDRLVLQGRDVRIDLGHWLRTGQLRVLDARQLQARVDISEGSVNRYLQAQPLAGSLFVARVDDDRLRIEGNLQLMGTPVSVRVEGDFEVRDGGSRIDFVPRHVSVDETVIPPVILDSLVRSEVLRVGVDLDVFPLPLQVQEVELDPGWIVIHAQGRRGIAGVAP